MDVPKPPMNDPSEYVCPQLLIKTPVVLHPIFHTETNGADCNHTRPTIDQSGVISVYDHIKFSIDSPNISPTFDTNIIWDTLFNTLVNDWDKDESELFEHAMYPIEKKQKVFCFCSSNQLPDMRADYVDVIRIRASESYQAITVLDILVAWLILRNRHILRCKNQQYDKVDPITTTPPSQGEFNIVVGGLFNEIYLTRLKSRGVDYNTARVSFQRLINRSETNKKIVLQPEPFTSA